MDKIENIATSIMTDFFKGLSRDMTEQKYNNIFNSQNRSPLSVLYRWETDSYAMLPIFRSEKSSSNNLNSFDIETLNDAVKAIKYALNNNNGYDDFKSYSNYLHIALFKYKAKSLRIKELNQNCIELHLLLSGFNWMDVDDRYFEENIYVKIPLRYLFNKKIVVKLIYEEILQTLQECAGVYEDMFDIYDINYLGISHFNISLASVDKTNLKNAMYDVQDSGALKSIISYLTDSEIICYGDANNEISKNNLYTDNRTLLDFIRIYYMLIMYNLSFSAEAFKNYVTLHYIKDRKDREIFDYIQEYLRARLGMEFNSYMSTYNSTDTYQYLKTNFDSSGCEKKIENLFNGQYITEESLNIFKKFLKDSMDGILI